MHFRQTSQEFQTTIIKGLRIADPLKRDRKWKDNNLLKADQHMSQKRRKAQVER